MKNKTIALLIVLIALPLAGIAKTRDAQLRSLAAEYKGRSGFEVVRVGGPLLSIAKLAAKASAEDAESRQALRAFDSLKGITVVDYDDCAPDVKAEFIGKVNNLLKDEDLLLEASDGDQKVRIFGIISPDGQKVSDVVMHVENDGALISFRGIIRTDKLGELTTATDIR